MMQLGEEINCSGDDPPKFTTSTESTTANSDLPLTGVFNFG